MDIQVAAESAAVLADLISIRNHLQLLASGPSYGNLSRDKQKQLQKVVSYIDEQVADVSLSVFDPTYVDVVPTSNKVIAEARNKQLQEQAEMNYKVAEPVPAVNKLSEEHAEPKTIPVATEVPTEKFSGNFRRS